MYVAKVLMDEAQKPDCTKEENKSIKEALQRLTSPVTVQSGMLRFYHLKAPTEGADANTDASKDLWIVKYSPNAAGFALAAAVNKLDSEDHLDSIQMIPSGDRAPKSGLQKGLEEALEKVLGKKGGDKKKPPGTK